MWFNSQTVFYVYLCELVAVTQVSTKLSPMETDVSWWLLCRLTLSPVFLREVLRFCLMV